MKRKILITALCMVLLLCVAVPCFASDDPEYEYFNGSVIWGDMNTYLKDVPNDEAISIDMQFSSNGVMYTGIKFEWKFITQQGLYYVKQDGTDVLAWSQVSGWREPEYQQMRLDGYYHRELLIDFEVYHTLVKNETGESLRAIWEEFKKQISVSTVVEVLVVLAGATVGLAFMWWGVRKLTRAVMGAFKKGRVNL